MKIAVINHSDTAGGASVVSLRLTEALRRLGHDARMIVSDMRSGNPAVVAAGHPLRRKFSFLAEHLRIFLRNGFNREDLFKVSICSDGLPLYKHPDVQSSDAVILNWVNQGMLSFKELSLLIKLGKPVLWVMHDMWNLVGICHHAGTCGRYLTPSECGICPLLHQRAGKNDLSHRVWLEKKRLYSGKNITFVAVSSWLRNLALGSTLMQDQRVEFIPNAFPVEEFYTEPRINTPFPGVPVDKKIILMGAARLDDPVKGLSLAIDALNQLKRNDAVAVFFGALRNSEAFAGLRFPHVHLGPIYDKDKLRELYAHAHVVLSSSHWENLPGTLIEGQAAGAFPVCFDHGGQSDIIVSPETGELIEYADTAAMAQALDRALDTAHNREDLRRNVVERFASDVVAERFLSLIEDLINTNPNLIP